MLSFLWSAASAFAQTPAWSSNLGALGPTGLAIANVGGTTYLYVAEYNGDKILVYNLTTGSTTPGVLPAPAGTFQDPNGIAVDPTSGDLFVTDRAKNSVIRISNTGTVRWTYGTPGSGPGQFNLPIGITRDSTGAIYVTEHDGNRVQKFTVTATGLTPVTTGWPVTGLNVAYSVATDANNDVYIGDRSGTIRKYSSAGAAIPAGNISVGRFVTGIFVAPGGALYTSQTTLDGTGNRVQRFPAGSTTADLTFAAADGGGDGQFSVMFNVVVNGSLAYISDYINNKVQVWNLTPPAGDTTRPTVNVAVNSAAATGTSVPFTVTFNETVTGASATSFALTGTAAGLTIGSVTPAPTVATTSYTVTANFTAGTSGTVTLGMSAAANTAIKDASNNFFAGGVTAGGQATATHTITGTTPPPPPPTGDTTSPYITDFRLFSNTATTGVWRITFNERVTGVDVLDFAKNVTGTGTTMDFTGVTAVGTGGDVYDLSFNWTAPSGAGSFQAAIKSVGTGIADAAGNPFRGEGFAAAAPAGSGVGLVAPTVTSFAVSGTPGATSTTLTVNFSEAVVNVDTADFLVSGATVGAVTGTGAGPYTVPINYTAGGTYKVTVIGGATTNVRDVDSTHWFAGGTANASVTFTAGGSTPPPAVPVVSNATVTGTVGTAIAPVQVQATNSPTSFSAPGLATYGLSISATGVISGTPTATAAGASVAVTATNGAGTSAPATITLNIAASTPPPAVPVVTNATVSGKVGTAITPVQVQATNSPTSFSAPGLATYGLSISATGVISGTPTATAAGASVAVTATNSAGTSAPATITLNIAANTPPAAVPVVTNATVTGKVGTAITPVQVQATNSPTSFSAPGLAAYGLSISATGVISGTPTATAAGASVAVTATNTAGTSAPATITLNITAHTTPPPAGAPVVSNATVTGKVGTAIAAVQVQATNSPTSFSAPGLAAYGLSISATGVISGTPTAAANGVAVAVTATNAAGTSAPASITLNIAANTTTPPPSGGGGGVVAAPIVKLAQKIVFAPVTGGVAINQPITLQATASSGLPVTFSLVMGEATINGNVLTPRGDGAIVVYAYQSGNGTYDSASAMQTLLVKQNQSLSFKPATNVTVGDKITLSAKSSSGLPVTFTVVSGGGTISGDKLTVTSKGTLVVRAAVNGDDTYNPATAEARMTAKDVQTITFNSPVSAILIGQPIKLSATSSAGLPVTFSLVSGNATIKGDTLTANGTGKVVVRASQAGNATVAAASTEVDFGSPQRAAQVITIPALRDMLNTDGPITLSATSNSGLPVTYTLVSGPATLSGNVLTLTGGTGAVVLRASQAGNTMFAPAEITRSFNVNQGRNARLINLSSRLRVTGGDASRSVIVGFVISGPEAKQVLVRAVGPGLRGFGVSDALEDPRLQLFNSSGTVVAENDNWTNADGLEAVSDRVGAFRLNASSRDAAIVATLQPGSYTAVLAGVIGNGVALIEVYDAATGASIGTSNQLVNISTRGYIGGANDDLIAGFVVTGNSPKRVLVRGVGPALGAFGVTDALANPMLQIFAAGEATVVAQNDNWGTGQPEGTDIVASSTVAGAFPLAAGSSDAAVVVTLMPGNYTAVVTGSGGAGVALVEVYELPNP